MPALFGSRHQEPLPYNLGYVPSRSLSIIIFVYVILNIVFSSINFKSFQPGNIFWPSEAVELCEYVGNRTGVLSLVNMSLAILFAGRNTVDVLAAVTGSSQQQQTRFLALHRWMARVAMVQALVHSVFYTLIYFEPGYDGNKSGAQIYAEKAAEPYYWWGIIGTIALCLATAFAILPIRIKFYEFFLITHIVLIILVLVACWYHLVPHFGFKYGYQVWLYISFGYWIGERLTRLARIAYYNRFGDAKATVAEIPGSDILHVTVFPRTARGVGPGKYTFLYFPGLGRFWESHPFSIAGWETLAPNDELRGQQQHAQLQELRPQQQHSGEVSAHLPSSEGEAEAKYPAVLESELGIKNETPVDSVSYYNYNTTPSSVTETVTAPSNTIARSTAEAHKYHNDACIHLLIRAHSGMTGSLHRYLSSPSTSSRVEVSVYTEGFYGGHRSSLGSLYTADTILCLVGGLGITHALGFLQTYVDGSRAIIKRQQQSEVEDEERDTKKNRRALMAKTTRFVLAWSAREMPFIEHVRQSFLSRALAQGVEVKIWHTGRPGSAMQLQLERESSSSLKRSNNGENGDAPPTTHATSSGATTLRAGRMDIAAVVRSSVEAGRRATVLVCGPCEMADEARKRVVECVKDGLMVDLVEEAFAW